MKPVPLAILLILSMSATQAQTGADEDVPQITPGQPVWTLQAVLEAQALRQLAQPPSTFPGAAGNVLTTPVAEATPESLPQMLTASNINGVATTYIPMGPVATAGNNFFAPLGTNGRTCQTCHQPANGWSITPSAIQALFKSTPSAPLFRVVDGAVCGDADTSTLATATDAYSLLLSKGLIRIFLPMPRPPNLQFSITSVVDPYDCTNSKTTGLTSPTTGLVSVYRRPLPTTNIPFLSGFMWDGRELSLQSQATDAVAIHAQGTTPPNAAQLAQIVAFESDIYSAQTLSTAVGTENDIGAQGGPQALANVPFHIGINDVLGGDPTGTPFTPLAMTMFVAWNSDSNAERAAVARGMNLFNEKPITITGVAGLNDLPGQSTFHGFCTTCHDAPNVGDHSVKLALNIGVVAPTAAGLDTTGLPVFTIHCDTGPLAGQVYQVTDPGKALISGQCTDIGKTKGPILRNLSARPPYFHNGSAPDLTHVVEFYNTRFGIGFTAQEQSDLIAFLSAL